MMFCLPNRADLRRNISAFTVVNIPAASHSEHPVYGPAITYCNIYIILSFLIYIKRCHSFAIQCKKLGTVWRFSKILITLEKLFHCRLVVPRPTKLDATYTV